MKNFFLHSIKYFFIIFLLLAILALTIVLYVYFSTHTQTTGELSLPGLQGKVTIVRDRYGVPHINAMASDNDAFFALGYVHAQDRLWQMEVQRRIARGTLSELFGEATLPQDKFLRTFGFHRAALAAWPALNASTRAALKSYTAGVNAFMKQKQFPLQFKLLRYQPEPWTAIDSLSWTKMMAYDLQDTWRQKITNYSIAAKFGAAQIKVLLPYYPAHAPTVLSDNDLKQSNLYSNWASVIQQIGDKISPTLEQMQDKLEQLKKSIIPAPQPGNGSNAWVVRGELTDTHKPLLASDPHLALKEPSTWYLAEVQGPKLHVIGATLPGIPCVVIGHNEHVAWGATNVNPDTQDLYLETPNTKMTMLREVIKIKNKPDVILNIAISSHGPVINAVVDELKNFKQPVAIKWTALLPNDTTVESFLQLNYAKNWQDFTNALRKFIVPSQNFVYADTQGNIGYYLSGEIPLRQGWQGRFPVQASDNLEWAGFVPFEQLPHVYNPSEKLIVTANNKPITDHYPYQLSFRWNEPPYRAQRILNLLHQDNLISRQDMKHIQLDVQSYLWRDLKTLLLKTKPLDAHSKDALALLKNWNGRVDMNSIEATIFSAWFVELSQMPMDQIKFSTQWREPLFIKQQLSSDGVYCKTPQSKNCDEYLSNSLQAAVTTLKNKQGSNQKRWVWENLHILQLKQLILGEVPSLGWIWNREIAIPGGDYTVNVGNYDAKTFSVSRGASYRQIVDLNNFDQSLFILPPGQSQDPFNAHYRDLLTPWRDGEYIPMTSNNKDWGATQTLNLRPVKP